MSRRILATRPREQAQAVLARLAGSLRAIRERVPIPLLVENMPYYATPEPGWQRLRLVIEPAAIWQLVEETGVGLLLDAAHLRVAAYHLGVDERAYARALPLHVVREIHVSGPLLVPGQGLRDRHRELAPEDYAFLGWLLERTEPRILTLEYGGAGPLFEQRNDPQALERQLRQLHPLVCK